MKYLAYLISSLIGFAVGHYLLDGAPAAYASILIAYHLFLCYLVVTAEREKGLSLPIGQTIMTHLAFLGLVIGIAFARRHIPFFGLIRYLIPALAPFETQWLFGGKEKMIRTTDEEQPRTHLYETTAEDHEAFREYLLHPKRSFRKPGMTVDDEFRAWLADRASKRPVTAPAPEQPALAESPISEAAPPQ
jgi:hypothetical protein